MLATLVVATFFGTARYLQFCRPDSKSRWFSSGQEGALGAEYNDIAIAIYEGRGFSDPFGVNTGATAWMPPVLPYLTAAAYWVFGGKRSAVIACALCLQAAANLAIAWLLIREAHRLRRLKFGVIVLLMGFAANFKELFQTTHDTSLLSLIVCGLWYGAVRLSSCDQKWKAMVAWGLFGGLVALSSPVLGGTWCLLSLRSMFMHVRKANSRKSPQECPTVRRAYGGQYVRQLMAIAIAGLVITPWMVRNRMELGKWVPIKSNGVYELWQSQCVDDDGVLDAFTLTTHHPWASNGPELARYIKLGEIRFIDDCWPEVRDSIWQDTFGWIGNLGSSSMPRDAYIAVEGKQIGTSRSEANAESDTIIEQSANNQNNAKVFNRRPEFQPGFWERFANRWVAVCFYYTPFHNNAEARYPWPVFLIRLVHPIPVLAILLIICFRPLPIETQVWTAISIYCFALLPYVLISYYERYAAPVVSMKMLLVLYGYDSIMRIAFQMPGSARARIVGGIS